MTKAKKKLIIVLTSVVSALALLAGSFALILVYGLGINEKRAVIIVPGLFASALYDADSGASIWDPFEDIEVDFNDFLGHRGIDLEAVGELIFNEVILDEIPHLLANGGKGDGESIFNKFLEITDDGESVYNVQPVPFTSEKRTRFGFMNAQKNMWEAMNETYGDMYEVTVFNYDFRMDNYENALLLQKFIEDNGYDEVILVSHSNGGLVVADYLAVSQENRDKVQMYLSYDAPYFGASMALTTLENINDMPHVVTDLLAGYPALSGLSSVVETIFNEQVLPLLNMYVVYQLLPTYDLFQTPAYYYEWTENNVLVAEEQSPYIIQYDENGKRTEVLFDSNEELYAFYCSRPWAHVDNDVTKPLRAGMKNWLESCERQFVITDSGERVHSTTLVDTTYFCGIGYSTDATVVYRKDGDDWECSSGWESDLGDGTVLLYSGSAGCTDVSKIVIVHRAGHFDVAQSYTDFTQADTERIIASKTDTKHRLLKKWIDLTK